MRPVLEEAIAAARAVGNRRHASRALWGLGFLALRRGEPARAWLEESCALSLEFGDDVFLTMAIPELARAHLAEGRVEIAARLLGAGAGLRTAIGMAPMPIVVEGEEAALQQTRAALGERRFEAAFQEGVAAGAEETLARARDAAAGHDPAPGADAPVPQGAEELTAREVDVLRLVARGLTDAQVASELVVSRRTVHAHLRAVYRKLDVRSRHAASVWAMEHGLT